MRKLDRTYRVRNLKTGEEFLTRPGDTRQIDGVEFVGVWREKDPARRVNYMRRDTLVRVRD